MSWYLNAAGPYLGDRTDPADQLLPDPELTPGADAAWVGGRWTYTRRPLDPVTKLTIVNRMISSGHSNSFRAFLAANPDAADQWNAATVIYAGDPQVRAALTAINADPDAILAYDPAAQ